MDRTRDQHSEHHNEGWHRAPVRGSTFDRGLPYRESSSGRDYPGGRHRVEDEYGYNRGPYMPPELEDQGRRGSAFDVARASRDPNRGGLDLGGGMDEDWDRELGLREGYDRDLERRGDRRGSISGPFTGRGPKGYHRSNDQIRADVCERLTMHGQIDASDIEVHVEDGEVTLEGTVDSRATKRLTEDVVESLVSVRDVHNRLRIRPDEERLS